ncbi:MAG: glycosyltransferase [Candidatus Beckwithbacteria bacterium]|nr:glycosyltransferase [Candidatus Beckwithbacteria bacterium]
MKIAFVYDRINKFGGAERVLLNLHKIWPSAQFFTAVYNQKLTSWTKSLKIKSSWLQKLPLAKTFHELYPWLTPLAFESFNFDGYDVVISVTSAEAKAIITKPSTLHICYCLTPTRYLWSHYDQYQKLPGLGWFNSLGRNFFNLSKNYLRRVDLINSRRPDIYLAISQTVKDRIKKYYHQDSMVIYPPVDTQKFSYRPAQNYFLVVSRLTPYKKVDLAVKACNLLKEQLIIVGSGREKTNLRRLAGPTIKFAGTVSDTQLVHYYQNCRALIMPQEEDFGIVSVEAQASGKPVIAYQKGGATETIISGESGVFFQDQTVDSLGFAMKQFNSCLWDRKTIQSQAQKFDNQIFIKNLKNFVEARCLSQNFPLKP